MIVSEPINIQKELVVKLEINLTDDQINTILGAIQLIRGVYNINTLDWKVEKNIKEKLKGKISDFIETLCMIGDHIAINVANL